MDPGDCDIFRKLNQKFLDKEKVLNTSYKKLLKADEEKKEELDDEQRRLTFWKSIALKTFNLYLAEIEDEDLKLVLYSMENIIRNLTVHLKSTAQCKLGLLGGDDAKELEKKNTTLTRLFVKNLFKLETIGMIICRRAPNSILKLVGREKSEFVVVINTPPMPNFTSIFGCSWAIYRRNLQNECPFLEGWKAESVGYAVMESTTTIVSSLRESPDVKEFIYDNKTGNFVQFHLLSLPKTSTVLVYNQAMEKSYDIRIQKWLAEKKKTKDCRISFIGQPVLDINQIIHSGGVYLSPSDKQYKDGKLRTAFSAVHFAYILDKLQGKATDMHGNGFLRKRPVGARQHSTFIGGSEDEVNAILKALSQDLF